MLTFSQVRDAAGVASWHAVEERSIPIDQPGQLARPYESLLADLGDVNRAERVTSMHLATYDGDVVGNAMLQLPQRENRTKAMVHLTISPEHRGRGFGRALAAHVVELARAEGRAQLMGMVASPLDGDAAGLGLAASLGAVVADVSIQRELALASLDERGLARLARELVGSRADGYRVVTWQDIAPESLVDGAAQMMVRMSTDTPQGDLGLEPEAWDAARYRERERTAANKRQRVFVAGAVEEATDELVAYTDVGVSTVQPTVARQWDTVIHAGHRGHRLGLAVKIENLAHLRRASPSSLRVVTLNAASNSYMIDVNDALGFRPVRRVVQLCLDL